MTFYILDYTRHIVLKHFKLKTYLWMKPQTPYKVQHIFKPYIIFPTQSTNYNAHRVHSRVSLLIYCHHLSNNLKTQLSIKIIKKNEAALIEYKFPL